MCWCNIKGRWRKMMGSFFQPTFLLRRLLSNHSDFSAKSVVKDWTSSFPPLLFSFLFWKRHLSDYSVANSQKFLWSSLPIYLLLFAFLKTAKIQKVESYPEKKMAVFLVDIAPGTSNPWNLNFQRQIVMSKNIFFSRKLTINFLCRSSLF